VTPFGWTQSQTISFTTRADCGNFISYQPQFLAMYTPAVLSQECLPDGRVRVSFNWSLANAGASLGQYLPNMMFADLSIVDTRFLPGTFVGFGEVSPAQQSLSWNGLLPGRLHFFRLNGYGSSGWMPSQPISFMTMAC
jgi:hypothetical protein